MDIDTRTIGLLFVLAGLFLLILGFIHVVSFGIEWPHSSPPFPNQVVFLFLRDYIRWVPGIVSAIVGVVFVVVGRHQLRQRKFAS